MGQEQSQSNELLAQKLQQVESRLVTIERKLDEKYISHETFDLVVTGIRLAISESRRSSEEADTRLIKIAMFFATPLYLGIVALLFNMFSK